MKKIILSAICFLFLMFVPVLHGSAEELTPTVNRNEEEQTITVTAKEGEEIGAVYIKWNSPVSPYQIRTEQGVLDCGQYGFLHEFIPLEERTGELTILLPSRKMKIYELRIFTDGDVPADVQIWQPSCEQADIMLVSAHSDDEILFMGGIIPTYGAEAGAAVQVVYMTEFWSSAPVREHEKLDGLWTDGLRYYPVCGNFRDVYAKDKAQAEQLYDLQAMADYLTDEIRRFRPQVVVTHDFDGEYGHGFHQLTAEAVSMALEAAADESCRTDTDVFQEKGTWDVPKAYFHLYPENAIRMDLNVPLASMGGQTALEAAKAAYLKHVSQQWCWFYVSDTYEYSCADFGLYRTGVGPDTQDNMLENIVTYSEQERLKREEQERLEREEQERLEREEQERLKKEEQERLEREEQERLRKEEQERLLQELRAAEEEREAREQAKKRAVCVLAAVVAAVLLTQAAVLLLWRGKKHRRRKNISERIPKSK